MMRLIALFALVSAAFGIYRARRLKGKPLDQLQYGAVYALIGILVAFLIIVITSR